MLFVLLDGGSKDNSPYKTPGSRGSSRGPSRENSSLSQRQKSDLMARQKSDLAKRKESGGAGSNRSPKGDLGGGDGMQTVAEGSDGKKALSVTYVLLVVLLQLFEI